MTSSDLRLAEKVSFEELSRSGVKKMTFSWALFVQKVNGSYLLVCTLYNFDLLTSVTLFSFEF